MLLPIYVDFLGLPRSSVLNWLTLIYTLGIAYLMVSRLPVFSGKRVGKRVPPELVGPLAVVVVLFFALLISYPWVVLTSGTVLYLGSLPFGWLSYREHERRTDDLRTDTTNVAAEATMPAPPLAPGVGPRQDDEPERPTRLN